MPAPSRAKVSTRERVTTLTEQGLTAREIAAALGLTTQAIYRHLKAIETDTGGAA